MARVLHVDFTLSEGWALPIIAAAKNNPALSEVARRWRDSELSDLAFTIETRLGAIQEVEGQLGEYLLALSYKLPTGAELDKHLDRGAAVFAHTEVQIVRRFLIAADSLVSESRSCFENLAEFNRLFLGEFLNEHLSANDPVRYEKIATLFPDPTVAEELRTLRHTLRHKRSPWLEFLVEGDPPRFEPQLQLDWRPENSNPDDRVSMQTLRDIHFGLFHARQSLQEQLTTRAQAFISSP